MSSKILCDQNWKEIEKVFLESTPFNYTIIDNVLSADACQSIREQIISHWGWRLKNWQSKELYLRDFELLEIKALVDEIKSHLLNLLKDYDLVQHVAFWHKKNAGLTAHSDPGEISFNLWITPDEYNLDKTSGGLVLYDVKRNDNMLIHEFNAAPYASDYLVSNTKGKFVTVPYRFNRAVIFDAKTFHASDTLNFLCDSPESARINFTMVFDEPTRYKSRYNHYKEF